MLPSSSSTTHLKEDHFHMSYRALQSGQASCSEKCSGSFRHCDWHLWQWPTSEVASPSYFHPPHRQDPAHTWRDNGMDFWQVMVFMIVPYKSTCLRGWHLPFGESHFATACVCLTITDSFNIKGSTIDLHFMWNLTILWIQKKKKT